MAAATATAAASAAGAAVYAAYQPDVGQYDGNCRFVARLNSFGEQLK